jgi:hypothetical protein
MKMEGVLLCFAVMREVHDPTSSGGGSKLAHPLVSRMSRIKSPARDLNAPPNMALLWAIIMDSAQKLRCGSAVVFMVTLCPQNEGN